MTRSSSALLYRALSDQSQKGDSLMLRCVDGPHQGERLLLIDGRPAAGDIFGFLAHETAKIPEGIGTGIFSIGSDSIFAERPGRTPSLIICGGGHVAQALVRLAVFLDFHVTVLEDRPEFAEAARIAGAHQIIEAPFSEGLSQVSDREDNAFAVMTRGHGFDTECLMQILKKPHAYVGMMGSRSRTALMKKELLSRGFPSEELDGLHAPIGLSIGAETPEEIALSVAAELVRERRSQGRRNSSDDEILSCLCETGGAGRKILCTVIQKHGSAPRAPGTKMLICDDGRRVGTIGGGTAEYLAERNAADLMKQRNIPEAELKRGKIISLAMNSEEAGQNGMLCGGRVSIYLEYIEPYREDEHHE